MLLPAEQVGASYIELRARVVQLLRTLPVEAGSLPVPHCPDWTVQELAGHILGVPDDIVAGRMENVASDAWTQAQVERHRNKTLREIAEALEALSIPFDALLPHVPDLARSQMVMDAVTHEHDLRHAVGQPGARQSVAIDVARSWLENWAEERSSGSIKHFAESGCSSFDVVRMLTGRRSLDQVAALGISVERLTQIQAGSPLRAPAISIEE